MLKLENIKEYHKNPRKISEERFEHLKRSLEKFGDLGGVVVNRRTGEAIGGNQRTKSLLAERERYTFTGEDLAAPQADGTVLVGRIVKDKGLPTEQSFSYREVDWDEKMAEEANIVANKVTGFWDYDILANNFDTADLLSYGFSKQDLDLLPKNVPIDRDEEGLTKTLDSYLAGNIKQIVLFFKSADYDDILRRMDRVQTVEGLDNHTDAFLAILKNWENENPET